MRHGEAAAEQAATETRSSVTAAHIKCALHVRAHNACRVAAGGGIDNQLIRIGSSGWWNGWDEWVQVAPQFDCMYIQAMPICLFIYLPFQSLASLSLSNIANM